MQYTSYCVELRRMGWLPGLMEQCLESLLK